MLPQAAKMQRKSEKKHLGKEEARVMAPAGLLLGQPSDEPEGRVWGGCAGSPSKRGGRDLAPFPLSDFRRLITPLAQLPLLKTCLQGKKMFKNFSLKMSS